MDTDDLTLLRRLAQLMGWRIIKLGEHQGDQAWFDDPANYPHLMEVYPGQFFLWTAPDQDSCLWSPLHAIGDAKSIIEHLQEQGWHYELGSCIGGGHYASFGRGNYNNVTSRWETHHTEQASEMERAIALAALSVLDSGALRTEEGETQE